MPVALGTHAALPGYDALTFTLMPGGYTSQRSVPVSGFDDIGRLAPLPRLRSASCSSGQRFAFSFLQIRSHPRHPCRSANSSPGRVSKGLPPPSECALPGAPRKRPAEAGLCHCCSTDCRINTGIPRYRSGSDCPPAIGHWQNHQCSLRERLHRRSTRQPCRICRLRSHRQP